MILVVLWALSLLLAMVPDVDLPLLGRVIRTPAGALPVILVVVGLIGIGWAHVPWSERIGGFDWFPKLLVIPLLMVQFHRSPRGHWVLLGFLLSATVLLMLSWYLYFTPYPPWRIKDVAVPFKDRITQGTEFTLCLFGLLELAAYAWKNARFREASLAASLAALYFLNIMFATVSRTALVAVPTLLVLFGFRYLTWPRMVAFVAGLAVVAGILWVSSPYLRERVSNIPEEITTFQALNHDTSAGSRLKFWERSIEIMSEAPLAGHGTGAITATFRYHRNDEERNKPAQSDHDDRHSAWSHRGRYTHRHVGRARSDVLRDGFDQLDRPCRCGREHHRLDVQFAIIGFHNGMDLCVWCWRNRRHANQGGPYPL
jgi:O-antigen ligase